jgi:catechol 2,3-dioxygenase-like lactoylglutathione lyase family enzyme
MECTMDHIVLNVEDDEAMVAFYSGLLGLTTERLEEYRAGQVPFPSVRMNADTIIDLFPKRMWSPDGAGFHGRGHLNHFCMVLKQQDWEALLERLQSNNIPLEDGPAPRWGAHGTGTSIYFRDPEGTLIEARFYDRGTPHGKCLLGS